MNSNGQELARRAAALDELRQRAAGPPPESWRPDLPELAHPNPIGGTLLRVFDGPADPTWGVKPAIEIQDETGMIWIVRCFAQILQDEFDQTRHGTPRPGDLVAITYEGRKTKRDGSG